MNKTEVSPGAETIVCFVGVKDSDDEEEENNTSPVKRPASLMMGKKPALVDTSLWVYEAKEVISIHC